MTKEKYNISRRKFLGQASCAGIGYTTLFSTLLNLKTINASAINNSAVFGGNGYKALVCVMLPGGADSFNMLPPKGQAEWNEYKTTRSNLALERNTILSLNDLGNNQKDIGLHPSMPNMRSLFNDGEAAFLTNVGSLVTEVNKTQFENESVDLPLGLFSHSDQIMHWQTGIPHERVAQGWGGKIADMLEACNENKKISMNLSLGGSNIFQTGNKSIEFSIDANGGATIIEGYGEDYQSSIARTQAIDNMLDAYYEDMYKRTYVDIIKLGKDGAEEFNSAISNVNLNTFFSEHYVSQNFKMAATTIAARSPLRMNRQIFFINYGGWDHHDEVLESQEEMLRILDNGLMEFRNALKEIGEFDNVVTFTMSEFGRTLTSNGNGTDHAWGGNVMMMGGPVRGQHIYGNYPSLELNNALDVGNGVLIPTHSVDEYFAELSLWFGVPPSELYTLFPNIGNFYSPGNEYPIGFLNA